MLVSGSVDIHSRFCFPDSCPTVSRNQKLWRNAPKVNYVHARSKKNTQMITQPLALSKWVWFIVQWCPMFWSLLSQDLLGGGLNYVSYFHHRKIGEEKTNTRFDAAYWFPNGWLNKPTKPTNQPTNQHDRFIWTFFLAFFWLQLWTTFEWGGCRLSTASGSVSRWGVWRLMFFQMFWVWETEKMDADWGEVSKSDLTIYVVQLSTYLLHVYCNIKRVE